MKIKSFTSGNDRVTVVYGVDGRTGVTQEMINQVRAADEQKMLRDLQRLSRRGHDFEFRGQRGETPVIVRRRRVLLRPILGIGLSVRSPLCDVCFLLPNIITESRDKALVVK